MKKSQLKKGKNPLDSLKESPFKLDDFKKAFLNTHLKKEVLDEFWKTYDPEGYSLWFVHYNKSPSQGKNLMNTSNFKSMFLQKLDVFRKYTFSTIGIYGEVPNLEIEGVFLWRGLEIPQEFKDHDSYEFITFRKLDQNNEQDKKLITDFWLKTNENDIVNGQKVVDAEYFK